MKVVTLNMSAEASPQAMQKCKRYDYIPVVTVLRIILDCVGIGAGLALIGGGVYFYISDITEWWSPILVGVLCAWFMYSVLKMTFENSRPIVTDEIGISSVAFGRTWKTIAWSDVKKIERIRRVQFEDLGNRYGYDLLVVGSHDSIVARDSIRELPDLLSTLNAAVQHYQIPLLARDIGDDTRAKIRATVADRQERKRLLKEGIQTSISKL